MLTPLQKQSSVLALVDPSSQNDEDSQYDPKSWACIVSLARQHTSPELKVSLQVPREVGNFAAVGT